MIGLAVLSADRLPTRVNLYIVRFIGVTCCLYALVAIRSDIHLCAGERGCGQRCGRVESPDGCPLGGQSPRHLRVTFGQAFTPTANLPPPNTFALEVKPSPKTCSIMEPCPRRF